MPKLYFSLVAAANGFKVVLGDINDPIFRDVPDGICLLKDIYIGNANFRRKLSKSGAVLCVLEEEGLILDEDDFLSSFDSQGVSDYDIVFSWGESHTALLKKAMKSVEKIIEVGSLKFDLCELYRRYWSHQKADKDTSYEKKILINTRFSYTNGLRGSAEKELQLLKKNGYFAAPEDEKRYKALIANENLIFNEFVKLIEILSGDPKIKVTIRAHPAENEVTYKRLAEVHDNILVDRSTDLLTQICSNDLVIHDGCTTAIEAAAMDVVVFGLRPVLSGFAYNDYANSYSQNFSSATGLANAISSLSSDSKSQSNIDEIARVGVYNWKGNKGFAASLMLDAIAKNFELTDPKLIEYTPSLESRAKKWARAIILKLNQTNVAQAFFSRIGETDNFISRLMIAEGKFGEISGGDVRKEISRICALDPSLGEESNFIFELIDEKVVTIRHSSH